MCIYLNLLYCEKVKKVIHQVGKHSLQIKENMATEISKTSLYSRNNCHLHFNCIMQHSRTFTFSSPEGSSLSEMLHFEEAFLVVISKKNFIIEKLL